MQFEVDFLTSYSSSKSTSQCNVLMSGMSSKSHKQYIKSSRNCFLDYQRNIQVWSKYATRSIDIHISDELFQKSYHMSSTVSKKKSMNFEVIPDLYQENMSDACAKLNTMQGWCKGVAMQILRCSEIFCVLQLLGHCYVVTYWPNSIYIHSFKNAKWLTLH